MGEMKWLIGSLTINHQPLTIPLSRFTVLVRSAVGRLAGGERRLLLVESGHTDSINPFALYVFDDDAPARVFDGVSDLGNPSQEAKDDTSNGVVVFRILFLDLKVQGLRNLLQTGAAGYNVLTRGDSPDIDLFGFIILVVNRA